MKKEEKKTNAIGKKSKPIMIISMWSQCVYVCNAYRYIKMRECALKYTSFGFTF